MIIYTLWEEGGEREMPWLVAAIDEYSVENCGWPEDYEKEREAKTARARRELRIEVPDAVVERLFKPPIQPAMKAEPIDTKKL